jgi:hypothetical protein
MSEILSPTRPPARRAAARAGGRLRSRGDGGDREGGEREGAAAPLGRYLDRDGRDREVIVRAGSAGSLLVVDRDALTLRDRRLVAHLAADEPAGNAHVVCRRYLEEGADERCRCRRLTHADSRAAPFADEDVLDAAAARSASASASAVVDAAGRAYRLLALEGGMSIPELRWRRYRAEGAPDAAPETVSLRETVARVESYEPACSLTRLALRAAAGEAVSSTVLRLELARVLESPIVLNRRLREAVLRAVAHEGLSMSEIAIRCGRVKRDRRGNLSGETSWLARRLGLAPEGGHRAPTPWIHSDVLGLIARRGLGISPREVEL